MSEIDLSGGIWRLKWHPFSRRHLLAACMYGGFKIIDCANEKSPAIVSEYNEHQSISYGCDWSYLEKENVSILNIRNSEGNVGTLVGTCSFYDHIVKVSAIYSQDKTWPFWSRRNSKYFFMYIEIYRNMRYACPMICKSL